MEVAQKQVIESFVRVLAFIAANPAPYGPAKDAMEGVVKQLRDHAGAQVYGRRLSVAESRRQTVLIQRILDRHMRPIVAIAKAAIDPDVDPRVVEALKMPVAGVRATKLLAAGKAMIAAAQQFEPVFVANGRPATFLAQLTEALAELENAVAGRAQITGTHVGAKLGIKQQLRRGRLTVARLDSIVRAAFEDNTIVLGQWKVAKRVHGAPGGVGSAAIGIEPLAPTTGPTLVTGPDKKVA